MSQGFDSQELDDLLEAARESPASSSLLRALVRAAERAGDATAGAPVMAPVAAHLEGLAPGSFDAATRRLAAAFLVERSGAAALGWVPDPPAEAGDHVLRARALLDLGRTGEAARAYRAGLDGGAEPLDRLDRELAGALRQLGGAPATPPVPTPIAQAQGGEVYDLHGRRLDKAAVAELAPDPSPGRPPLSFADIGGLADVKEQIRRRIILPFERKSLFERFRRRAGGGVLLYGPPGCGKTLMARATAGECRAAFIPVTIPEVLDMWLGSSEKRLAERFAEARRRRPAVLFFDEIEALAARRRAANPGGGTASLVSVFLSEMDGVSASNDGVLVLAATNVPWSVDSAFRRPGRFDRTLFVPPPDRAARQAILELELKDRPVARDVSAADLAGRTASFSGADLANLVETAADEAIDDSMRADGRDELVPIGRAHLLKALRQVKPSTLEWLTTARNHARFANENGAFDEVTAFLDRHGD